MFHIYASSSHGNFYEVNDRETRIALECGVSLKKMQELCGHTTAGFAACLVSHEHQDHAKAAPALLKRGIPLYMSSGTAKALGIAQECAGVRFLKPLETQKIGSLVIKPFPVMHDAKEPLGFLILSQKTGEKLLFATDTASIRYRFQGVREIAIECNFSEKLLKKSDLPDGVKTRILRSHMSLERVKAFLQASDLSETERIYLLHLSSQNSDARFFQEEIQRLTGISTATGF